VDESTSERPQVTETERRLAALLAEGRPAAEIAVRLGLTIAEVKARLERLDFRNGPHGDEVPDDAEAPLAPEAVEPAQPSRFRSRAITATTSAAVLVLATMAIWLVAFLGGASDEPARGADSESSYAGPALSPLDEMLKLDASIRAPLRDVRGSP
jgi:hypothetical protein